MAVSNPDNIYSFVAKADYSVSQFKLVIQDATTSTYVQTSTATTSALIGVLKNKPQAGEAAAVATGGISKVIYGAVVTTGDPLTSDSSGRAIPATVASSYIVGFANSAGVTSDIGTVQIAPSKL